MTLDLHIHVDSQSPEGQVIESIAKRDRVSPEEALMHILSQLAGTQLSPAEQMWGAFSSPGDSSLLDDVVAEAYERRLQDQPRDFRGICN